MPRRTSQERRDASAKHSHVQQIDSAPPRRGCCARLGLVKSDNGDRVGGMFASSGLHLTAGAAVKELMMEQDVTTYYKTTGVMQAITKSDKFQGLTLSIIGINSLWIGIELDVNKEENLFDAHPSIIAIELFFFAFFVIECAIRFLTFKKKRDCVRDHWFVFDASLVILMTVDTILLNVLLRPKPSQDGGGDEAGNDSADVSQLSLLRMGRLLRLTRMVRFMRAVPELVALMKAFKIAGKPVFWTMVLLLIVVFIFGVIFRSQFVVTESMDFATWEYLEPRLSRLPIIMWTLTLQGTFLDNIWKLAEVLLQESGPLAMVLLLFVIITSLMLLNLLVGVVVDVMSTLSTMEKEKARIVYIKSRLLGVLKEIDEDGNGTISRNEFNKLLAIPQAVRALTDLGVDVPNLVSLSKQIFDAEEPEEEEEAQEAPAAVGQAPSWRPSIRPSLRIDYELGRPRLSDSKDPNRMSQTSQTRMSQTSQNRTSQTQTSQPLTSQAQTSQPLTSKIRASIAAAMPRPRSSSDMDKTPSLPSLQATSSAKTRKTLSGGGNRKLDFLPMVAVQSSMKAPRTSPKDELLDDDSSDEDEEFEMDFADFIELVLLLRSSNTLSMLDIVHTRKLVLNFQSQTEKRLKEIEQRHQALARQWREKIADHPLMKTIAIVTRQRCGSGAGGADGLGKYGSGTDRTGGDDDGFLDGAGEGEDASGGALRDDGGANWDDVSL